MHPVSPNYIAPRHPIVLCHGLFGFDKMGPDALPALQIHYWGRIRQCLERLGARVISVNFVAHSMGGLDCRHLITHLRSSAYIPRSLTTIATPHRGSPFMDWIRDHVGVGASSAVLHAAVALQEAATKESSDLPSPSSSNQSDMAAAYTPVVDRLIPLLDEPAYGNLTTTYLHDHFNPSTPNDPSVRYYSYGACAKSMSPLHPLRVPWEVVSASEGPNDGLVSLQSARWGTYVATLDADHWEVKDGFPLRWKKGRIRKEEEEEEGTADY
ncbi:MAG: Alpha/Beta hydrolase protein [Piptocephalis tieghemiana]|nr:MAG: Alpha/Beta hydrolase protein [Piptocephalis tieghemiana]